MLPSPLSALPLRLLSALGREGTRAVALSIVIGLVIPPLASLAKPLLTPLVYVMMVASFMRTDLARLRTGRGLGLAVLAVVWIMGLAPALLATALALGVPVSDPDILLAIVLQVSAPPIMAGPAFAILLGLDPTLPLLVMVMAMLVTPLSAPAIVHALSGAALDLDPLTLTVRLALVLAGTAAVGFGLRALIGPTLLTRWRAPMDGVNVILLALMAVAFMDGITRQFIAEPIRLLGISALAFTVSFGALAAGGLLFRLFAPADQALMIGFSSGLRNMMMLIAAAGGAIPDTTWLYVGLAQFPIYLLPYFMKPVANLIHRHDARTGA